MLAQPARPFHTPGPALDPDSRASTNSSYALGAPRVRRPRYRGTDKPRGIPADPGRARVPRLDGKRRSLPGNNEAWPNTYRPSRAAPGPVIALLVPSSARTVPALLHIRPGRCDRPTRQPEPRRTGDHRPSVHRVSVPG